MHLGAGPLRRFHREKRSRALQREGLRDRIVLAADAAHHLPVFEAVGHGRFHQGRHQRIVDKAGVDAGAPLGLLVAIEFVGEGRRLHLDPGDAIRRHLPQRATKRFRPEKERDMQRHAIDLAVENVGLHQADKRLGQHLADAVKAFFESPGLQRG